MSEYPKPEEEETDLPKATSKDKLIIGALIAGGILIVIAVLIGIGL